MNFETGAEEEVRRIRERFPTGQYVRVVAEGPIYNDPRDEFRSYVGRVGRVANVKRTRTRGIRVHVAALKPGSLAGWKSFDQIELAPATREDWDEQRCLDRLA